jgi:hypothetical protein
VDAVDGTDLDARVVLHAAPHDHVRHGRERTKQINAGRIS